MYAPSTWPGHRAAHIPLPDGQTSIFDLYGLELTIVDFSANGVALKPFEAAAKQINVPPPGRNACAGDLGARCHSRRSQWIRSLAYTS